MTITQLIPTTPGWWIDYEDGTWAPLAFWALVEEKGEQVAVGVAGDDPDHRGNHYVKLSPSDGFSRYSFNPTKSGFRTYQRMEEQRALESSREHE